MQKIRNFEKRSVNSSKPLLGCEAYIQARLPCQAYLSHVMRKPTMWFPNKSDTNRAVQPQKMARGWKFCF